MAVEGPVANILKPAMPQNVAFLRHRNVGPCTLLEHRCPTGKVGSVADTAIASYNTTLLEDGDMNERRATSVPTDEELSFARRKRAQIDQDWDAIAALAEHRLREVADLHNFAIFPRELCCYAAIVFFNSDEALSQARHSGFDKQARELIAAAVGEFRRDQCTVLRIDVELDSYENVKRNFGGSYFNRLR